MMLSLAASRGTAPPGSDVIFATGGTFQGLLCVYIK